jgi:nicotinamide mononucleotide (NMN) deamidase PncC
MYSDKGLSLEQNIFKLLKEQKSSLIISEIATSGELSSSLIQADPTSRYLKGSYVAGNSQMMHQLLDDNSDFKEDDLSENVVYQIAELLANKKKANWILVVGSVSKNKDESESVWIAVGSIKKGFITQKIGVRKGRRLRQDRLVTHALDLLRKELSEYSSRR